MLKPDEVLRLREVVNQLSQFGSNPEWVFLADHVAAELKNYDHDGKPLPVDREWLLGLGGESPASIPDRVTFYNDADVCRLRVSEDGLIYHNGSIVGSIAKYTRPRFLALLVGLGISHKEIA